MFRGILEHCAEVRPLGPLCIPREDELTYISRISLLGCCWILGDAGEGILPELVLQLRVAFASLTEDKSDFHHVPLNSQSPASVLRSSSLAVGPFAKVPIEVSAHVSRVGLPFPFLNITL